MAKKKKSAHYSGIGGQAVLEGVMMKNKDDYAVAIRKADGEIDVEVDVFRGLFPESRITKIPFLRGIFNFIDSLRLGMKCINHSAQFYEDGEAEETKLDKALDKISGGRGEKILMGFTTVLSIVLAVAIFILLPYYLSTLLNGFIRNDSLLAIIEGVIRIAIFLLYIVAISLMKDIHRLYQYHGAEHKTINCFEAGDPLTPENVKKHSRYHKRCGTSFLVVVMIISIIVFMFINVKSMWLRLLSRVLLVPIIAGISYEFIMFAGRSDSKLANILSVPGMWVQRLTTKEPDLEMCEVAIRSVEAVIDWSAYQDAMKRGEIED